MPRLLDAPNMSDATILITVEDLIYRALGSPDECTINFNLLQMILHILARQMRMLEQRVEIREDLEEPAPKKEKTPESSPETSSKSPRSPGKKKGKKEEGDTGKDTDMKKKGETKDKEKAEKLSKKEEKAEKLPKKEEKPEKMSKKEEKAAKKQKEKAEKERKKLEEENEKEKAQQEKKGAKTTRIAETDSRTRANIEVVTQSKFALLEAAVEELKTVAAPKELELPDNEQLKSEIASGTANLPDTMQAMQVNARVKAAEEAINRMAGILTQLAVAGDLPEDLIGKISQLAAQKEGEVKDELKEIKPAAASKSLNATKSVSIDPKASQSKAVSRPSLVTPATPKPSQVTTKASVTSSNISSFSMGVGVTHNEMDSALRELHQELSKNLNNLTTKATASAESALHTAKVVADRLDVVLKVDSRISTLHSLVGDYAEQLSGFDAGLTTQMQSFRDQMAQIRGDLQSGLDQLQNVNNNAETEAVMELTERYKELTTELDSTAHAHKALNSLQNELGGEMHSLVGCVEMLREQKCDRDEIIDGLRDKADSTRLAGLLTEVEFAAARADFERRIELCHDKFRKQDAVWMSAVRDLTDTTDKKAEIVELLASRDDLQTQLQELLEKINILAAVLGEPKAAILTRQLAKDAVCGSCGVVASMSPREHGGARREPPPCMREWVVTEPGSEKHVCRRWCGGSHTLLSATTREHAKPLQLGAIPTTHYTDYGDDGRLYMMADELKPCIECNMMNEEGAGDFPAPPPSQGN